MLAATARRKSDSILRHISRFETPRGGAAEWRRWSVIGCFALDLQIVRITFRQRFSAQAWSLLNNHATIFLRYGGAADVVDRVVNLHSRLDVKFR